MRLLGSKMRQQEIPDSSVFRREPVVGSRKVSWENRNGHSRQTTLSSAALFNPTSRSFSTELGSYEPSSNLRRPSNRSYSNSSVRRFSHQTDTTSQSIEPDARSIRIRKSDFFQSRPKLKHRDESDYTRNDGALPTLHTTANGSPFIDALADHLDTRQLRTVLDTDARRRQRRRSAMTGLRDKNRLTGSGRAAHERYHSTSGIPSGTSLPTQMTSSTIPRYPSHTVSDVEITTATPVYDRFMEHKILHTQPAQSNIIIPGASPSWHDADAILGERRTQPGVILAGNRESFPDFAVVDRTNSVRQRSGSGVLTTAWTSLWKRAGTARSKKELDVADHRNRTLGRLELDNQSRSRDLTTTTGLSEHNLSSQVLARHLSSDSAVLFDNMDTSTHAIGSHWVNGTASTIISPSNRQYSEEMVPKDAFYDPITTPRVVPCQTHSRNFSRPTNDSRAGQRALTPSLTNGDTHTPSNGTAKMFSPLLSGDSFPIPEQRASTVHPAAGQESGRILNGANIPPLVKGYSHDSIAYESPILAAGISQSTDINSMLQSTTLNTEQDVAVTYLPAQSVASRSKSLLSTRSRSRDQNSGLAVRTPMNNDVAGISHADPPSSKVWDHSRAAASMDTLRMNGQAGKEHEAATKIPQIGSDSEEPLIDDSATETTSTTEKDSIDDYHEEGIWRTGVGRSVQVVVPQQSPVLMNWNGMQVQPHTALEESAQQEQAPQTPQLVERASFLSSVQTFHTAEVYSNYSASSSKSTLRSA